MPASPSISQSLLQEQFPSLQTPDQLIAALQEQILALQDEVNLRRRRDDTLKFYMQRLDEELRLAARLQYDFLPRSLPEVGSLRFNVLFRPAGYVSGDMYDVLRLDETHVAFYIADAVGHGMPAALLTMFMKRALVSKEILASGYRLVPPAEALGRLNNALVEQDLSQATFATALYGIIDTQSLNCTFARAGHPGPVVLTASGQTRTLEADGGLLGIFPNDAYTQTSVDLHPGDRLFLFTDGVEVAFSEKADTDPAAWQRQLSSRVSLSTADLLADLARAVDSNAGSLQPKDDLTVMVAEISA